MTPLISARRAAEDFARVVDGSQADVADRYADLTATVELLRTQDTPASRPEFVADLRTRLMLAADTLLVPAEKSAQARPTNVVTLSPAVRRHNRRLAVAAAAFVVVGGTAGIAAAAESALPGDPLYPIKRGIESAQVSLNTSDSAKGHDLISQASTRLDEIDGLMSDGDSTSRITHTLASFERSATSGADLLFVSYQRDGDVSDLASLRGIFSEQIDQLHTLAGQAPPTAQPDFDAAASLLADLDQQARVLCGDCGPDTGDFTNTSSAPALESLLEQPAAAAAADLLESQAKALAAQADAIAGKTPKTSSTDTAGDSITPDGALPGVEVPDLTSDSGPVKSTVTGVTDGVEGLLGDVGSTTGLTPVTDTVNNTLDALTGLLLGQ
jgi:hypothetical protein